MNSYIAQADIKVRHVVHCSCCGCTEEGGYTRLELASFDAKELPGIVQRHLCEVMPQVPVRWAMYGGRDKLKCPSCH